MSNTDRPSSAGPCCARDPNSSLAPDFLLRADGSDASKRNDYFGDTAMVKVLQCPVCRLEIPSLASFDERLRGPVLKAWPEKDSNEEEEGGKRAIRTGRESIRAQSITISLEMTCIDRGSHPI